MNDPGLKVLTVLPAKKPLFLNQYENKRSKQEHNSLTALECRH